MTFGMVMFGTMSDVGSKNKWSYPNISPKFYQNIPPALSGADVSNSVRPRRDSNGHYLMRVILNIILNRKVLRNHHLSFSVEIQNVPCIMRWDWLKVGSGKPGQQHNGAVLSTLAFRSLVAQGSNVCVSTPPQWFWQNEASLCRRSYTGVFFNTPSQARQGHDVRAGGNIQCWPRASQLTPTLWHLARRATVDYNIEYWRRQ